MVRISSALVALLVLACTVPAFAQGTPPKRVILVDGTVITGVIADENADPVVVIGANGVEQRIPRARIAEITDLLQGRFTRYDPARTRLFFSPTARSLGSGVKRFSAYYLFPSLAIGVNDRVDISGGATVPFISSDGGAVVVLNGNAKATLTQSDGLSTAVGGSVLVPLASGEDVPGIGGTFYGLVTLGSEASAITLGAYGFYATDFDNSDIGNGTALLVGLEKQVSDRFKLVSENYLLIPLDEDVDGVAFGSLTGVRFFGDKLAADIAIALVGADGEFATIPFPYLGLSYTF
ncbi:MAG: hypothetical protein Rubg2KO_11530 [Rubricoccaceae bacterium]